MGCTAAVFGPFPVAAGVRASVPAAAPTSSIRASCVTLMRCLGGGSVPADKQPQQFGLRGTLKRSRNESRKCVEVMTLRRSKALVLER